ncbi:MAG: hypothetical protein R2795_16900 [Saprospiraceae bacterium]
MAFFRGKYQGGAVPEGSRWSMTDRHGNFRNRPMVHEAVAAYAAIAEEVGIAQSVGVGMVQPVHSLPPTIIGATSMEQLKENIKALKSLGSDLTGHSGNTQKVSCTVLSID